MSRGGYPGESLQGLYVLVVDSEAGNRAVLTAVLQACGALVREVASADEAWAAMGVITPRALILAVRPPIGLALTLVRRIRSLRAEDGGKIPTVAIGPAVQAEAARLSGCDGYLAEPIEPWALCRLVTELIS
jgi:CheY-like chemotaxis protein